MKAILRKAQIVK